MSSVQSSCSGSGGAGAGASAGHAGGDRDYAEKNLLIKEIARLLDGMNHENHKQVLERIRALIAGRLAIPRSSGATEYDWKLASIERDETGETKLNFTKIDPTKGELKKAATIANLDDIITTLVKPIAAKDTPKSLKAKDIDRDVIVSKVRAWLEGLIRGSPDFQKEVEMIRKLTDGNLSVKRSNGEIQTNWFVGSIEFDPSGNPLFVITDGAVSKRVPLDTFLSYITPTATAAVPELSKADKAKIRAKQRDNSVRDAFLLYKSQQEEERRKQVEECMRLELEIAQLRAEYYEKEEVIRANLRHHRSGCAK